MSNRLKGTWVLALDELNPWPAEMFVKGGYTCVQSLKVGIEAEWSLRMAVQSKPVLVIGLIGSE